MQERFTQTISTAEFADTPRLSLEQATGDVFIEGWDRPEIQVTSSDEEETFELAQSGSQVAVRSRPIKLNLEGFSGMLEPAFGELQNLGMGFDKVAARVERQVQRSLRHAGHKMRHIDKMDLGRWSGGRDYYVKVPHDCDLSLRTSTGDLRITGVTGTFFLQSTSGDTRLVNLSGNILITSASGDITLDAVEGKLGVRTASGEITIRGASLKEVSATTASGDIRLQLLSVPERDFEIKTVSGDLRVEIPPDARLTAEINTFSGDIDCDFPHEQIRRHPGRTTNLVINGGGTQARFASVSGDVSIHRGPGPSANRGQRTPDMDFARGEDEEGGSDDIREPEGYAARKQAELEILEAVQRGELSTQDALARLSQLDGE
ncbi:MAG: DUF4097 family beta strand repeat-containing protein [Chloroflexia bacterium]